MDLFVRPPGKNLQAWSQISTPLLSEAITRASAVQTSDRPLVGHPAVAVGATGVSRRPGASCTSSQFPNIMQHSRPRVIADGAWNILEGILEHERWNREHAQTLGGRPRPYAAPVLLETANGEPLPPGSQARQAASATSPSTPAISPLHAPL